MIPEIRDGVGGQPPDPLPGNDPSSPASEIFPKISPSALPSLPAASPEAGALSSRAAAVVWQRLDQERCRRESHRPGHADRITWVEVHVVPAFEAVAASLRATDIAAAVECVSPYFTRLRIGDVRHHNVERWIEVNGYPTTVAVTARVGHIVRDFPACHDFPSGENPLQGPNRTEIGLWLESLVTQMFAA